MKKYQMNDNERFLWFLSGCILAGWIVALILLIFAVATGGF